MSSLTPVPLALQEPSVKKLSSFDLVPFPLLAPHYMPTKKIRKVLKSVIKSVVMHNIPKVRP